MGPAEAKAYITWFRHNHLPEGADFVRTSTGLDIALDSMTDEEAVFVASQFEDILDAALRGRK
jgi:hypothetical protein